MARHCLAVADESLLNKAAGLAHVGLTGLTVEEYVVFIYILSMNFWIRAAVAAYSAFGVGI